MKNGRFVFKSILGVILWTAYVVSHSIFKPVLTNKQALGQFQDSSAAFTDFSLYQFIWNWLWIVPLILCILLFIAEIKRFYKKLRGGF
ncbi:MAG: hypothetical protein Q8942_08795 [Bacillota bacterium]|nr:hypothetical protein [Bacillota bacterium]